MWTVPVARKEVKAPTNIKLLEPKRKPARQVTLGSFRISAGDIELEFVLPEVWQTPRHFSHNLST